MSTNIPGTRTGTDNLLLTSVAPAGNAVIVVGNTSSVLINKYSGSAKGSVYTVTSYAKAVALLGSGIAGTWTPGSNSTSPFDPSDNLLRALEMVYLGNPSAKVYFAGVDGVIADTTAVPAGATTALADMLEKEDVGYVCLANLDPVTAGVSHVEAAASETNPYNSPRFYVAGIDMFSIDNLGGGGNLDDGLSIADISSWTSAAASSVGLTLAYVGNHTYSFQCAPSGEGAVEIGGQYMAPYLAGVLTNKASNFAISYAANGFGKPQFDGKDYVFNTTEIDDMIKTGWLISRYVQGAYVFAKGVTLNTVSSWDLYTHRQITNTVHKNMVANLVQFLGKPQTPSLFSGAQKLAEGILSSFVLANYIATPTVRVSPHETEVDAINATVFFTTIKPVHRIYLNLSVS